MQCAESPTSTTLPWCQRGARICAKRVTRVRSRALTSGSDAAIQHFTADPAWAGVYEIPQIVEIAAADNAWWHENLAADGLAADRITLVRRAAEGLAVAAAYGDETPATLARARDMLLSLTLEGWPPGPHIRRRGLTTRGHP